MITAPDPRCSAPAGRRAWAAGNGGGGRGVEGVAAAVVVGCCIPLTQVGDSSPAGRAPGHSGERDSHQSRFTFFISPTNLFLFKHHFFCSGTQLCLALNSAARCVCVFLCVRLHPLLPKDLFSLFFIFCESGFQTWRRAEPLLCVCVDFFFLFFLEPLMSAAHNRGGFGPIFVYNADTADFFALFQFFNYVSSGG